MSDKNPYYSIPKALGEPVEEISLIPHDPVLAEMAKFYEECWRQVREMLSGRPSC